MIGRAADHHPVKPLVQQALRLRKRGDTTIYANRQMRKLCLHPQNQIIVQGRDLAVFFRAQTLQPSLTGMDDEMAHARSRNLIQEAGQHGGRVLVIHPDPAFDRHRHIGLILHRLDAIGHQRRALHQHRPETS